MSATIQSATPVLPAADLDASLAWWTTICGFTLAFRQGNYAGISRDGVSLHIAQMDDPTLARTVGDQTMLRLLVDDVETFYTEYKARGGHIHPNGALQTKPWGSTEFATIDPNGVCVTFLS